VRLSKLPYVVGDGSELVLKKSLIVVRGKSFQRSYLIRADHFHRASKAIFLQPEGEMMVLRVKRDPACDNNNPGLTHDALEQRRCAFFLKSRSSAKLREADLSSRPDSGGVITS